MSEYLYFAEEMALWAMDRISARRPVEVATKSGPADFVTETDLDVEKEVRERIAERFPGHAIVGEEFGADGAGELVWHLDPVDGTTNFAHGLPWSSFSLAVADSAGALAGVVADPWRGEIFSASRGDGARLNGVPIQCARTDALAGALVLTEWTVHRPWPGQTEFLAAMAREQCTTRVLGSTALSLASVAAGRASGVVLDGYSSVDVMAGVLVCRESGCLVWDRQGHDSLLPTAGDGGLLAATPALAPLLLAHLGS